MTEPLQLDQRGEAARDDAWPGRMPLQAEEFVAPATSGIMVELVRRRGRSPAR